MYKLHVKSIHSVNKIFLRIGKCLVHITLLSSFTWWPAEITVAMEETFFAKPYNILIDIFAKHEKQPISVDDDTCLDRILRSIREVVGWNPSIVVKRLNEESGKTLFSTCSQLFENSTNYPQSTLGFGMRLFSILSSFDDVLNNLSEKEKSCWKSGLVALLNIDTFLNKWPSTLKFSWLKSVHHIMASRIGMNHILEHCKHCESFVPKIFLLSASLSMFVKKEAISIIAELTWATLNVTKKSELAYEEKHEKDALCDAIVLNLESLPLDRLLQVLSQCWKHPPKLDWFRDISASQKLFDIATSHALQINHKQEMCDMAAGAHAALCNFLNSVSMHRFPTESPLFPLEFIKELAEITIIRNPTKQSSYVTMTLVAEFDLKSAAKFMRMILVPFQVSLGKTSFDDGGLKEWSNGIEKSIATKRNFTNVMRNCCYASFQIFSRKLAKFEEVTKVINHMTCALTFIYDIQRESNVSDVNSFWFQNYPLGLAIFDFLKGVNDDPCIEGSCLLCTNPNLIDKLTQVLNCAEADQAVVLKAGKVAVGFVANAAKCSQHPNEQSGHENRILEALLNKCNDVRWEVRDSSLEVLHDLLLSFLPAVAEKGAEARFLDTCRVNGLVSAVLLRINDESSFVRASALHVGALLVASNRTVASLASHDEQASVIGKAVEVLRSDEEAFARRGAVAFLHSAVTNSEQHGDAFLRCLANPNEESTTERSATFKSAAEIFRNHALHDPDWEVRRSALVTLSTLARQSATCHGGDLPLLLTSFAELAGHLLTCGDPAVEETARDVFACFSSNTSAKACEISTRDCDCGASEFYTVISGTSCESSTPNLPDFSGDCHNNCHAAIVGSCCPLPERRKRLTVIHELNDLLELVLFKMNECDSVDQKNSNEERAKDDGSSDYIHDCY